MASTSSKNNEGNYLLEQTGNSSFCDYLTSYKNNFGNPNITHFAGDGILHGRVASKNLSSNACDIESQLFGIGTSNMVKTKNTVIPMIHNTKTLNMIDRLPIMIPQPLVIEKAQRPNIRN